MIRLLGKRQNEAKGIVDRIEEQGVVGSSWGVFAIDYPSDVRIDSERDVCPRFQEPGV